MLSHLGSAAEVYERDGNDDYDYDDDYDDDDDDDDGDDDGIATKATSPMVKPHCAPAACILKHVFFR